MYFLLCIRLLYNDFTNNIPIHLLKSCTNLKFSRRKGEMKMKAYITCPVTNSDNRLNLLPEIESTVKAQGLDTFVFIVGGSAQEIFERDYNQIKLCDLIIAEVSEPSHGVGIEIGFSYTLDLKRILLIEEGKSLSKLAQGIPETFVIQYKDIEEMKKKLESVISNLK